MQETHTGSLGQEDPLGKEMATHSNIHAWRILMDRGAWQATVHRVAKSWNNSELAQLSLHTWHGQNLVMCFPDGISTLCKNSERKELLVLLCS